MRKLRISLLKKKHVMAWLKEKGCNPTSQNRAIGAVKRAFNWAVEEEHIPRNPIAHLRKPEIPGEGPDSHARRAGSHPEAQGTSALLRVPA